MEIKFQSLAERPEAVPLIAGWYFKQWGYLLPENSLAETINRVSAKLNHDTIPFHLLSIVNHEVIGIAELKFREMDEFPEKEHWLGSVYVIPSFRQAGVASKLIVQIVERAKKFGVRTLYLQTRRSNGGLYTALGWTHVVKTEFAGKDTYVMAREI